MKRCSIIGYASGVGGRVAGSERGPAALRALGLASRLEALEWAVADLGDVGRTEADLTLAKTEILSADDSLANNARQVCAVCHALSQKVAAVAAHSLPVVLGGDHSLSVGTMAGLSGLSEQMGFPIGLLWVDAHADLLTPRESSTRNLHGMTVASILGAFPGAFEQLSRTASRPQPAQIAYLGLRDVELPERARMRDLGIPALTMSDIDRRGLGAVLEDALRIVTTGTAGFLLSFDLDVCDPDLVPGTGVKMRGGLTFREAHLVMEMAWASGQMRALEMVELNPLLDVDNRTAELAVSLIESGLGLTIL